MATSKNTIVYVYRGVPLDPEYNHCVYFQEQAVLLNDINRYRSFTGTGLSIVRTNDGIVRLNVDTSQRNMIEYCNYIGVQNQSITTKIIFGFIDEINYINDNCVEIKYTIDVITTYLCSPSILLGSCFVERCHVSDDTIGLNTLPEPVDIGNPIVFRRTTTAYTSLDAAPTAAPLRIIISAPFGWDSASQTIFDNYSISVGTLSVNGHNYPMSSTIWNNSFTLDNAGLTDLQVFLSAAATSNRLERIIQCAIMPYACISDTYSISKNVTGTLNGHTVRNNKLYTYPYNYLKVDNSHGNELILRYEDFNSNNCDFRYYNGGDYIGGNASMSVLNYEQPTTSGAERTDLVLNLPQYPHIPIIGDAYQQWLANQIPNVAGGVMQTGLSALGGFAMGGAPGAAAAAGVSIASRIFNFATTASREAAAGKMVIGSASSSTGDLLAGRFEFGFSRMHLRPDVYEAIDSYFDVFGYNVSKIMTPNLRARATHTYIKTSNVSFTRNLFAPRSAVDKITSILNRGVTFWRSFSVFGNYSAANGIV